MNWLTMRKICDLAVILMAAMLSACGSGGGSPASPPGSAPTVLLHTPAGTDVPVNAAITALFSKPMNATGFTTSSLIVTSGGTPVTGSVSFNPASNTVIFTSSPPLNYSTNYTVTLKSGIRDTSGIAMANDYTWSFTTRSRKSGDVDTSFGNGSGSLAGIVVTPVSPSGSDAAPAVAIQPDGKIVAAGSVYNGTDYDFAVVRYNTDGTLDTSFGAQGKVITPIGTGNDLAYGVAIDKTGNIIVAGSSSSINADDSDFALARYTPTGALDTSFDGDGKVTTSFSPARDAAYAIKIQSDGNIVVAGLANGSGRIELNGQLDPTNNGDFALARYNPVGTLDISFGSNRDGKVTTSPGPNMDIAVALAIDSNDNITVAGISNQRSNNRGNDFALARYTSGGNLDTAFGTNSGIVITSMSQGNDAAYAIAIQTDGMIVAAGIVNSGSHTDFALARYQADGQPDSAFGNAGQVIIPVGSANDTAFAVAIQPDGRIILAGTTFVEGRGNDFAVVRRRADGSADDGFGNGGKIITSISAANDQIYAIALGEGTIVVAGSTGEILSTPQDFTKGDFALARYWQ